MEHVDPYAVLRNTATLQAYRDRQKAAHRSAQPFLSISACAVALALLIYLPGLLRSNFRTEVVAISSVLLVVGGVTGIIAARRRSRYLREHPSAVSHP
jgi:Flp pilus assembly protein TadB